MLLLLTLLVDRAEHSTGIELWPQMKNHCYLYLLIFNQTEMNQNKKYIYMMCMCVCHYLLLKFQDQRQYPLLFRKSISKLMSEKLEKNSLQNIRKFPNILFNQREEDAALAFKHYFIYHYWIKLQKCNIIVSEQKTSMK